MKVLKTGKKSLDAAPAVEAPKEEVKAETETEPESVKTDYTVTIKGDPTDTNIDAQKPPHRTNLEIQCANQNQHLDNFNFPVKKTFNWSSQNCGDVILKIWVGNLILTKEYKGDLSFPRFLKDFSKGHRVFFPNEFYEKEKALKLLGIKYIKIKYRLTGHKPVLRLLNRPKRGAAMVPQVPVDIVKCWAK